MKHIDLRMYLQMVNILSMAEESRKAMHVYYL